MKCLALAHHSDTVDEVVTVLVIDSSPSMKEKDYPPTRLEAARAAAEAFIRTKERVHPGDQVGLVAFNEEAHELHRPVRVQDGAAALRRSLRTVRVNYCTNIHAGLEAAYQALSGIGGPGVAAEVVLLSDGSHNTGPDPIALAADMKAAGIRLYAIAIGSPEGGEFDADELKAIASPDCYFHIGDSSSLITRYKDIASTRIVRGTTSATSKAPRGTSTRIVR